ncbi:hypothetical protein C6503_23485 [Candidatus Poribacteria bacterium]|nr:MAG: hypothetical protein C6503_23485 [Candidatus Poribacteria bacterium]
MKPCELAHNASKTRFVMNTNMQNKITTLEARIAELEQQLTRVQESVPIDRIECRELRIVSDTGEPLVTINAHEELESGIIRVFDKTGLILVSICGDDQGGSIAVCPTWEASPNPEKALSAEMSVDDNGNGFLSVCDNEGDIRAVLSVAHPSCGSAGRVTIHGTVDNRERVVIGCNPETDAGSIKTYGGDWHETHSLENEPGDLRMIGPSPTYYADLRQHRHTLEKIDEKLQNETDEDQKRFLNVKKSAISEFISRSEDNETP